MHRFTWDDPRCLDIDTGALGGLDRSLAVDRIAEGIHDPSKQAFADRHVDDGAGPFDHIAFLDAAVVTKDNNTDIVRFQVERHAADAAGELDHLTGLDIVQPVDTGDTVSNGQNLTDFGDFCLLAEVLDLIFQDCGNFRGTNIHQPTSFSASLSELSLVFREVSICRDPILTTSPPRSDGSTATLIDTSFPATLFNAAFNLFVALPRARERTEHPLPPSPRCSAAIRRNALIMPGTANSRRFRATTARKLATSL